MLKILYSFRKTTEFTRKHSNYFSDDEYTELQWFLINNPTIGDLIIGGSGIRKIRWKAKGHGKSGGVRVIYYFAVSTEKIFMLNIYAKNEQADLNAEQLKQAKEIVEEWKDEQRKF